MSVVPFYALKQHEIERRDGTLRLSSEPVDWDNDAVADILNDLIDTFRASKISVGLAAIQIGVPKRIFVMNTNKDDPSGEFIFINPRIISASGPNEISYESCMSMPNLKGKVRRKKKIVIEYFDTDRVKRVGHFSGFPARVIQHEMGHLDGILCLDRIEGDKGIESADYQTSDNYPLDPIFEHSTGGLK